MRDVENELRRVLERLFPLPRSLTGEGNRETLRILGEIAPITVTEYPSGTPVYDWTVPREWRAREAWIKNGRGEKVVDYARCNLHLVSYSRPVHARLTYEELLPRLHFREDLPRAVPYRTAYYAEEWGFCLSFEDFRRHFRPGETYEVLVDAALFDGALTVGEIVIPGRYDREFLVSTYICHPSLANDNLTGPVLAAFLARELAGRERNYGLRFVFAPETVGVVAYLAHNTAAMAAVDCGLVLTCLGGRKPFSLKRSFDPGHWLNALAEQVLRDQGRECRVLPFDIHGSDERQYSAPGLRLNTTSICQGRYYEYPEYHTSLDDLGYVSAARLADALDVHRELLRRMDEAVFYRRVQPHGEIMLSRHGLYPALGGGMVPDGSMRELDLRLWLLFLCDGRVPVDHIAASLGQDPQRVRAMAALFADKGVLVRS